MKIEKLIPQPRSRFLLVRCPECGNEQKIFGSATTTVLCIICNRVLAEPTRGKAQIVSKIIQVLE
ncbi:MAG: 30S ribosomal protein S27e [Candidatus Lokiarchaeota archaeon]|nr:30S ribosomal protein S27e [Candidatus Lokiarchaeota archaeon]